MISAREYFSSKFQRNLHFLCTRIYFSFTEAHHPDPAPHFFGFWVSLCLYNLYPLPLENTMDIDPPTLPPKFTNHTHSTCPKCK